MDRRTEERLGALKDWRGPRAEALKLDPGVLCPNAALEAIAWADPSTAKDMKALPELKAWLVREFADEIIGVLGRHEVARAEGAAKPSEKPSVIAKMGAVTSSAKGSTSTWKMWCSKHPPNRYWRCQ